MLLENKFSTDKDGKVFGTPKNTSPARIQKNRVEAQPSLVRTDTLKILHEQHQRPDSKRSSAHIILQNVFPKSATK